METLKALFHVYLQTFFQRKALNINPSFDSFYVVVKKDLPHTSIWASLVDGRSKALYFLFFFSVSNVIWDL